MHDKSNVTKVTSLRWKIVGIRKGPRVSDDARDFDLAMWSPKVDQFANYGFQRASCASNWVHEKYQIALGSFNRTSYRLLVTNWCNTSIESPNFKVLIGYFWYIKNLISEQQTTTNTKTGKPNAPLPRTSTCWLNTWTFHSLLLILCRVFSLIVVGIFSPFSCTGVLTNSQKEGWVSIWIHSKKRTYVPRLHRFKWEDYLLYSSFKLYEISRFEPKERRLRGGGKDILKQHRTYFNVYRASLVSELQAGPN